MALLTTATLHPSDPAAPAGRATAFPSGRPVSFTDTLQSPLKLPSLTDPFHGPTKQAHFQSACQMGRRQGVASGARIEDVQKDFKPHVLLNIGFSKLRKGLAEPQGAVAEGLGMNATPHH